ncbi:MAG: flippase-like domain-containing protein [Gemmatales bacterium]|nr:flippase-like domain-containing protein [Gemmatales bacterium]MDW8385700.1 lysylphosphatidylglycerol synthase transmembrane domain-containing protein [Gemmatales bacterium]
MNESGCTEATATPRRKWLGLVARLVIGLGILAWLIHRTDWEPLALIVGGARLDLCLAALGLYCLAQVISSYRWKLLAQAVGFTTPLHRLIALYFVGMFFNLFLPTSMGGDVVRAWLLAGKPGRRWPAILSVFSERFAGLMMLLLLACLASLVNVRVLPWWSLLLVWGATAGGFLFVLLLPLLGRRFQRFREMTHALSLYRSQHRTLAVVSGLSLLVQIAGILQVWILSQALGLDAPWTTLAVVVPLVTLLTMLPISVNGVGVREAFLMLLLAPVGVSEAQAVALGLLWLAMLATASLLGGIVFVVGGFTQLYREEQRGPVCGHSDQGRTGQSASAA